jgi:YHS domain-containing protein
MKTHSLRLVIGMTVALLPNIAMAQHEQHQPGAQQASAELIQCARVQPLVDNIVAGAMARLESARQSNNPSEMRAAVDHLEAALRDIRAQLEPCKSAASAADPHARHTMPGSQQAPAGPTPEIRKPAADPHAGHAMPGAAAPKSVPAPKPAPSKQPSQPKADPHAGHETAAAPKSARSPKTTPSKTERPQAADPHAGHASGQQSDKQMDPVNGLMVDPATAPKTTYQGRTYYFSSEQSRKEFLANPSKFAKKPKG